MFLNYYFLFCIRAEINSNIKSLNFIQKSDQSLNFLKSNKIISPSVIIQTQKSNFLSSISAIIIQILPFNLSQTIKMPYTFSSQFNYYISNLLENLNQIYKQTAIQDIYFTRRCHQLVLNQRISEVQLFGCGFKKIYNQNNISPYLKLNKIVIVSNIDQQSLNQLDQIEFLFPQTYLLTLQTTNSQEAQLFKNSKIKNSIKLIKQINLNFFTFLDHAHFVQNMEKSFLFKTSEEQQLPYTYQRPSQSQKLSSYRSFLLSFPKIYEYELHFIKTNFEPYNKLIEKLQRQLSQSLGTMQRHEAECKNLDKLSSPKIKFLVLNRQIINDFISPLIYGYFYGPLCEESINRQKLIEGAEKLSSKGKMYNHLFEKDFNQSAEEIQKIVQDKTALEGPFQTNYFHKAKKVITSYEDPSPIEVSLHITTWKQTKKYGETRLSAARLQQDITNRVDEYDKKVSNGNSVSRIKDWILNASQQQKSSLTEEQSIKLAILSQITGDLWFFHNKSLKKLFNDEMTKRKYDNFLAQRQKIPTHYLKQKYQPLQDQKSQIYRHEPNLLPVCQKWLIQTLGLEGKVQKQYQSKMAGFQFDKRCINNDIMRNRGSKLIIIIDGMIGYNELALLRRGIKKITNEQVSIMAESYCNSQQYSDYLTRPVKSETKKQKSK